MVFDLFAPVEVLSLDLALLMDVVEVDELHHAEGVVALGLVFVLFVCH